jgi:hypothetical protein
MGTAEQLERAVRELPEEELRRFREWFHEFEEELWDRQIERDHAAGKLDALIEEGLADQRAGRTRTL